MVMVPTKKVLEVGKPAGQRRLITFGEMASVLVLRGAVMLASASPLVAFRVSMLPTALDIRVAPRAPPVVCVSSWYDSGLRLDGAAPTPPASSGAGSDAASQLEDALAAQAAAQAEANAELEEASKADAELEAALENEVVALKEAVEAMDPAYQESLQEAAGAAETEEAAAEAAVAEAEAALAAAEAAVASASQTEAAAAAGSAQAQSTFEERAAARVAARAEARGEAAPAVGVATPPPAAPVAAAPAGAIAKQSTLSPALSTQLAKYELYDPTTLNDDDQTNTLSAMAFGAALLFLLPVFEAGFLTDVAFSALFGGGLAGYAALRKDAVGAITRDVVGDTSNKAVRRSCCKGQIAPATATTGAVSHRPLHARAIALTHAIAQHMPSLTHAIIRPRAITCPRAIARVRAQARAMRMWGFLAPSPHPFCVASACGSLQATPPSVPSCRCRCRCPCPCAHCCVCMFTCRVASCGRGCDWMGAGAVVGVARTRTRTGDRGIRESHPAGGRLPDHR